MHSNVLHQALILKKGLGTLLAFVAPLACVTVHVAGKRKDPSKCLGTMHAFVRSLSRMCLHVEGQTLTRTKGFGA